MGRSLKKGEYPGSGGEFLGTGGIPWNGGMPRYGGGIPGIAALWEWGGCPLDRGHSEIRAVRDRCGDPWDRG